MGKKKKNPNKNKDKNNADNLGAIDLEEDSKKVTTSWEVQEDDLKRLKLESAKQGVSVGGYLRDLVSDRFKVLNRSKKDVSSKLVDILDRCDNFFGGFDVSRFINRMFDAGIDLADLSNGEWVKVRSKIRSGSEDFEDDRSVEEIIVKFDLISPSRKQRLDLLKIFRE